MTEKDGGSDVIGATRTNATRLAPDEECGDIHFETWLPKPTHKLNGLKWFSSAADAEVALTLALYEEAGVSEVDGRPRLSLFLVRVTPQLDAGRILVQKLKSKMGTRQLPTAELVLDDALATRLGDVSDPKGAWRRRHRRRFARCARARDASGKRVRGLRVLVCR